MKKRRREQLGCKRDVSLVIKIDTVCGLILLTVLYCKHYVLCNLLLMGCKSYFLLSPILTLH